MFIVARNCLLFYNRQKSRSVRVLYPNLCPHELHAKNRPQGRGFQSCFGYVHVCTKNFRFSKLSTSPYGANVAQPPYRFFGGIPPDMAIGSGANCAFRFRWSRRCVDVFRRCVFPWTYSLLGFLLAAMGDRWPLVVLDSRKMVSLLLFLVTYGRVSRLRVGRGDDVEWKRFVFVVDVRFLVM